MKNKKQETEEIGFIQSLLNFPRVTRMIIAGVFALSFTLAISRVVDRLYEQYLYSENTLMLPYIISGGMGLLMYIVGWFAIVGGAGEDVIPSKAVVFYLLSGVVSVILVLIWTANLVIRGGIV